MKGCWVASAILMEGTACVGHAREPHEFSRYAEAEITGPALIVTGEKMHRPLQETPTSVSLTTSQTIADRNLNNVHDVLGQSPNVAIDGNRTSFSIRGIDAFNVSGGGDGPLASVYVDGVAIPQLAMATGPFDLFDVSQVEIFRGPQSTIQGRNALAGSVIVSTSDPGFDWTGKSLLQLSDKDGTRRAGLALGGPIIDDRLAFRLAAQSSGASGLIRNITTKEEGDRQGSETVRSKLLIKPLSSSGPSITGTFLYDQHRRGTFYTELDPPYAPGERIAIADVQDRKRGTTLIGGVTVRYEISPRISLISSSSYSRIAFRSISDADRTALPGQVSRLDDNYKTFQQEVRLMLQAPRLSGLIGANYLRERRDYEYAATQSLSLESLGIDRQLRAAGLPPATVDVVLDLYDRVLPIQNSSSLRRNIINAAAFADFTLSLSERLQLRAGLRIDTETQDRTERQAVAINGDLPNAADQPNPGLAPIVGRLNGVLVDMVNGASRTEPLAKVTYGAWLPRLGATYSLAKGVALSFTLQRGYRAGGSGFNEQRAMSYSFGPEYVMNYEAALRSQWINDRLILNFSFYRMDWDDQQVPIQLSSGSIYDTQIVNIGKSRLRGFEVEAHALAADGLRLHAGVGFSNARFKDFRLPLSSSSTDTQGKEFPRSPAWTLSGGATFSHRSGLSANINVNHRSGYYQTVTDQSRRDIAPVTLVNAKLGWRWHHFGAFAAVSNIFDVQKPNQFFDDIDGRRRGTLADPRIVSLTLESRL